jgi:hypothetical protein
MGFKSFCLFLGVGFGTLGVPTWAVEVAEPAATKNGYDTPDSPPDSRHKKKVDAPVDPRTGSTPWRQIATLREGKTTCPPVAGWDPPRPLLPSKGGEAPEWYRAFSRADRALISGLGLDRLCVYTTEVRPVPRFIIPPGSDLAAASPDRMAISVSGMDGQKEAPVGPQTVDSILADEFLHNTGPVSLPSTGPPNVRITFLDSEPDGALSFTDHRSHGYALGHLAHEIVCNGSCAATLWNSRALGYDGKSPDPLADTQAGYVGVLSELGPKILQAIGEWKLAGDTEHLILNLSIGWDGEIPIDGGKADLDAHSFSELDPAVQAVYGALRIAARNHVLVIAAAGNRRGGSLHDSNWPTLPAAWELHRFSHRGTKLVYAVGGVDWQGLPLPNARTKGLPRRVAYGDHATAMVNGTPTDVYTGSSVSAAVVSSVAAVVWNLRPELRPEQVMRLIDRSAIPTPQRVRADFYWGRRAPRIHEVSLCAAVKKAWRGRTYGAIGTAVSGCARPDWQPPVLSGVLPGDSRVESLESEFLEASVGVSPPCYRRTQWFSVGGSAVSPPFCPTDQFDSIVSQRWVLPQPGNNPCANCVLVPTGPPDLLLAAATPPVPSRSVFYDLKIELDPSWIDSALLGSTAMLEIDRFDGGTWVRRAYPIRVDLHRATMTVSRLGDGLPLKDCRAQLNWVLTTPSIGGASTTMSVQSPVVVDP